MTRLGLDPVDPIEQARAKKFRRQELQKKKLESKRSRKEFLKLQREVSEHNQRLNRKGKPYIIPVVEIKPPEGFTKDHIIPLSFLKKLRDNNIEFLSKEDNLKKADRLTKKGLEKILKAIIEHL